MSEFNKRRDGFEAKFTHDEELKFRVEARRNKLLGDWAADLLELSGSEKEAYAKSVVMSDLLEPGEEDVFRKLRKDFDDQGVVRTEQEIRTAMADMRGEAKGQIAGGIN